MHRQQHLQGQQHAVEQMLQVSLKMPSMSSSLARLISRLDIRIACGSVLPCFLRCRRLGSGPGSVTTTRGLLDRPPC